MLSAAAICPSGCVEAMIAMRFGQGAAA